MARSTAPKRRPSAVARAGGPSAQKRYRYAAPRRANPAAWAIPLIAAVIVLIVVLSLIRRNSGSGVIPDTTPVPASVLSAITGIPAATFNQVGASGVSVTPNLIAPADRTSGTPTLLYMGAEYCPYCAATRWPLIAALSRFGTFSNLTLTASSPTDVYPDTPTFSFVHSKYTSSAVQLQTVEMVSNVKLSNGQYKSLQTPTSSQNALFSKYDQSPYVSGQPGSIPFILIGGTYIWPGSPVDPGLLQGQNWSAIAADLATAKGSAAKAVLANANEFAAAICAVNGGQPASVCSSAGVKAAAATLPTKAISGTAG